MKLPLFKAEPGAVELVAGLQQQPNNQLSGGNVCKCVCEVSMKMMLYGYQLQIFFFLLSLFNVASITVITLPVI